MNERQYVALIVILTVVTILDFIVIRRLKKRNRSLEKSNGALEKSFKQTEMFASFLQADYGIKLKIIEDQQKIIRTIRTENEKLQKERKFSIADIRDFILEERKNKDEIREN